MTTQPEIFEAAEITLESDWFAVCANRENWEKWLAIAKEQAPDCYDEWTCLEACDGCKDLDGCWCNEMDYPATVNPVLKECGMPGMACMGMGQSEH